MYREWSVGDLAKDDAFDSTTIYNVIEAFDTNDRVNKKDMARPIRNVFENAQQDHDFLENWSYFTSMNNGVIKGALVSEFKISGDSDVVSITVDPGVGDTTNTYVRLAPGVAMNRGKLAVNKPNIPVAERQLNEIFNLETWNTEGVEIKYYYNFDIFQARIKRKNVNGITVNHDFLNGGTWGDSDGGYSTGVELLEAIYTDTVNFRDEFAAAIGVDFTQINLELMLVGDSAGGDTVFWYADRNGNVVGDSEEGGDSWILNLGYVSVATALAAGGDSSDEWLDRRTYIQNFNDFATYMFLNVPQEWGDTDTATNFTSPDGDDSLPYADITDRDTYIIFLRKSTGDTQDNSIFGWSEGNIPGIDETRSEKFFANKDIVSRWSIDGGDTVGASWASIKEMSGDSWPFYGNKVFQNGLYEFYSTDTTPDSFKIDTVGGIDLDVDAGFTLDTDSSAITLTTATSGDITLTSAADIAITANGDSINLTSTVVDVDVTADMLITTGDTFVVTSHGGILLKEDSEIDSVNHRAEIDIEADGAINIYSAIDKDINIKSHGDDSNIYIEAADNLILTASGDSIHFNTNVIGLDLTHFEVDAATSIELDANGGSATAVIIDASNAAGGIDIDAGTNGIDIAATSGNIDIHTITGGTIDISSAGTGNIDFDSNNDMTIDIEDKFLLTAGAGNSTIEISEVISHILIESVGADADIKLTAGNDIHIIDGVGDSITLDTYQACISANFVNIDAGSSGFDLDVTSGDISLTTVTSGDILLTSDGDIDLLASGDSITLTAYTVYTAGNNIHIRDVAGDFITLDTYQACISADCVNIDAGTNGFDLDVTNGDISLTTVTSGDITLTSAGDTSNIVLDSGYRVEVNATDMLITTGDTFVVTSTGGILLKEDTGEAGYRAEIDIEADGAINIYSATDKDINIKSLGTDSDIYIEAADNLILKADGDSITLTSNTVYNTVTSYDVEATDLIELATSGDASNIVLDSGNNIIMDAEDYFSITGGEGNSVISIAETAASDITLDTTAGTDADIDLISDRNIDLTAGTDGNISLLAASDDISLTSTNINLLGTNLYVGTATANYALHDDDAVSSYTSYGTSNEGVVFDGSLGAYKVYNAVWNDYAEGFEFDPDAEYPQPGFVYKQTEKGIVKTDKRSTKGTIGVYSDSAGMVMGSENCILPDLIGTDEERKDEWDKAPIAMAGKVNVWIKEKLEIGDILVAGKNGFATKANLFDRIFRQENVIGKVLEGSCCKEEKRVWMLVK